MTTSFGAGERSRTPDLLITSQLLYQLSYASDDPQKTEARFYGKSALDATAFGCFYRGIMQAKPTYILQHEIAPLKAQGPRPRTPQSRANDSQRHLTIQHFPAPRRTAQFALAAVFALQIDGRVRRPQLFPETVGQRARGGRGHLHPIGSHQIGRAEDTSLVARFS